MDKRLLLGTVLLALLIGAVVNAEEIQPQQDVEIKNSYLNVTSINKKDDAEIQKVRIDKCFLSIIRINLGDKEIPLPENNKEE